MRKSFGVGARRWTTTLAFAAVGCTEPGQYGGPIAVDQAGVAGRLHLLCGVRATDRTCGPPPPGGEAAAPPASSEPTDAAWPKGDATVEAASPMLEDVPADNASAGARR